MRFIVVAYDYDCDGTSEAFHAVNAPAGSTDEAILEVFASQQGYFGASDGEVISEDEFAKRVEGRERWDDWHQRYWKENGHYSQWVTYHPCP